MFVEEIVLEAAVFIASVVDAVDKTEAVLRSACRYAGSALDMRDWG